MLFFQNFYQYWLSTVAYKPLETVEYFPKSLKDRKKQGKRFPRSGNGKAMWLFAKKMPYSLGACGCRN